MMSFIKRSAIRSIRSQMRLIVLFLLAAFLIIDGLGIWLFIYRIERSSWRERQNEAIVNASNTISQTLAQVQSALYWLGNFGDPARLEDPVVIRTLESQLPDLMEFVYFDRNGNVLSKVAFDEENLLSNDDQVIYNSWFLQARNGKTFIGNIQYSPDNKPYIIFSAPVFRNGNVLAVRLSAEFLREVVEGIQFGAERKVYILDQDGSIIVHSKPEHSNAQINIRNCPEVVKIYTSDNKIWSGEYTNFEGVSVSGVSMPIPATNWVLIIEIPVNEVYGNTRLAAILVIGGMLLFAIVLFPLYYLVFEHLLMKPLSDLVSGSKRIGKGNSNIAYRFYKLLSSMIWDLRSIRWLLICRKEILRIASNIRHFNKKLKIDKKPKKPCGF